MPSNPSRRNRAVEFAIATDRGLVRTENQDAAGKFPDGPYDESYPGGQLFVVADGMGGHNAGREASLLAVKTIGDVFLSSDPSADPGATLRRALEAANLSIHDQGLSDSSLRGMGTTCTALLMLGDATYIAHVGDSRAYHIADTGMSQLTEDHTRVGELVRSGVITPAQAREHPERSFLQRALGARPTVNVDLVRGPELAAPCTLLLCTDGLHSLVDDEEIRAAAAAHAPAEAARALIDLALARGGSDNVTLAVVRVAPGPATGKLLRPGTARRTGPRTRSARHARSRPAPARRKRGR
jgi:protein phosphatase